MSTYQIIRFYRDTNHADHGMVVDTGLSLDDAQEHCSSEDTHEKGVWFDGYTEE